MSLGVKKVSMALINPKTFQVITGKEGINGDTADTKGIYTADQSNYGVSSVALSGLQGAVTPIWASDQLVFNSAGTGQVSSVLTINQLPNDVKMRILGNKPNDKGGYTISGKADPNTLVAFLVESRESFATDKPIYVGMWAGVAQSNSHTFTSSNTAESRTQDVITIAGVQRPDGTFGAHWFSDSADFKEADMLASVFPTAPVVPAG